MSKVYLCYRPDEDDEDEAQEIEANNAEQAAVVYCEANDFDLEDEFDVLVKVVNHINALWYRYNVVREVQVTYVAYPQGADNE